MAVACEPGHDMTSKIMRVAVWNHTFAIVEKTWAQNGLIKNKEINRKKKKHKNKLKNKEKSELINCNAQTQNKRRTWDGMDVDKKADLLRKNTTHFIGKEEE